MRIIPKKTKVSTEFFRGVSLWDILVSFFGILVMFLVFLSSLPGKLWIELGLFFFFALLLVRIDEDPNYKFLLQLVRHFSHERRFQKLDSSPAAKGGKKRLSRRERKLARKKQKADRRRAKAEEKEKKKAARRKGGKGSRKKEKKKGKRPPFPRSRTPPKFPPVRTTPARTPLRRRTCCAGWTRCWGRRARLRPPARTWTPSP